MRIWFRIGRRPFRVERLALHNLVRCLAALFAGLGLILGMFALDRSRAELAGAAEFSHTLSTPRTVVVRDELPRAWNHTRRTPHPTLLPTLTLTPTMSPTQGPSAPTSASSTLTAEPSPTLTLTPIHYPADDEPTRITIPAIDVDAEVVPVSIREEYVDGILQTIWEVADYAAGFHRGTALPGRAGNTVITGHNNTRGEVFRDLYQLKPGDDVYVWVEHNRYHYQVRVLYRLPAQGAPPEVQEDNLRWIMPTDDQRLTLVTCWPYWTNTHRIVVIALPAP